MKFLKYTIFIFLICSLCLSSQAQEQQKQTINDGSISDQFEFVIKKSTNWTDDNGQPYEVVKRNMMNTLRAHTLDTLSAIQTKLENANNTINAQQTEINTLKSDLADTQDKLASTTKEKDSMVFFGAQMSKSGYNTLMWSIIAAISALLLLFVYKFKNSNVVTQATKNALAELEDEFKEHRRTALKREQEVKRQLQDEINKHAG